MAPKEVNPNQKKSKCDSYESVEHKEQIRAVQQRESEG